ncbi:MAG: hypothetical protein ACTSW7_01145 [Candidatus Thorarchaeota archaeon]|nr:hypothetical protein [Thermoplasmatales archaeon]
MTCDAQQILEYKVNDTQPSIACTYKEIDSVTGERTPIDITGYTFRLDIGYEVPNSVTGSIVGAPVNGEFIFEFTIGASEVDEVGKPLTEIVIWDNLGNQVTYDFVKFNVKSRIVP